MTELTFGSLFAGIGGFDLGLERAGLRCAWQVEIDPHCTAVLARHWPGVARYADVRDCGADTLPPVDVITFGFPCQDVSNAGRRQGLAGARSGLFHDAIRIIRELRPTLAIAENVPGLLTSHGGADFAVVLSALANSGALDIGWRVLDAQWFGVPQRRRRVFLVADTGGRRAAEILALSDSLSRRPAPRRETGQGVAAPIASGAGGGRAYDIDTAPSNLIVHSPQTANSRAVRRLTPVECERLMGFPDGWTDGHADTHRYRMLGNSVAVPVIAWLGENIARAMTAERATSATAEN